MQVVHEWLVWSNVEAMPCLLFCHCAVVGNLLFVEDASECESAGILQGAEAVDFMTGVEFAFRKMSDVGTNNLQRYFLASGSSRKCR